MSALNLATRIKHKILEQAEHQFWNGRFSPDGRWIVFGTGSGPPNALQLANFVAPFRSAQQPIPRADWVPLPSGGQWSPDGQLLYVARRFDDHDSRCLWATWLNRKTKQMIGAPEPVRHFPRARLSFVDNPDWNGPSVARDKIVFTLNELRGNIWTASPDRDN
jgi:hypothetical protein